MVCVNFSYENRVWEIFCRNLAVFLQAITMPVFKILDLIIKDKGKGWTGVPLLS